MIKYFGFFFLSFWILQLGLLPPTLNCQLRGWWIFFFQTSTMFVLIQYICAAFFLAVFRAAVWIHPIKAWRCSWWPLANRTCQRFFLDPSPRTRKPHTDTLCPRVSVWIQRLLLFYSWFQSSHQKIGEANMLQKYTDIRQIFSIYTALGQSSPALTIRLNVVRNCSTF